MTRRELIQRVQEGLGDEALSQRQVAQVIDGVFEAIADALRDEGKYTHPGFGSFSVHVQGARVGRNPRTGEEIAIDERNTVRFKPSPELKGHIER